MKEMQELLVKLEKKYGDLVHFVIYSDASGILEVFGEQIIQFDNWEEAVHKTNKLIE